MFNPNVHHHQQQGGVVEQQHLASQHQSAQHQGAQHQSAQHSEPNDKPNLPEFPFCYNANMLPKTQPPANGLEPPCNDKTYRFDVSQPFSYNYALVNQMSLAAAASTTNFKCEVCGLVFSHLSLLNHHKRIHMNEAPSEIELFNCEICGASFTQPSDLKQHKDSVHMASNKFKPCTPSSSDDCDHKDSKKKKISKCKSCNPNDSSKMYETTQDASTCTDDTLQDVATNKVSYPVKRKKVTTVAKCEKCNGTGIIFVGSVEPDVEKPFHCNVCDSSFARYSSLWSHRRLHSGEKPFKCDLCGVTFARAAYLKNHNKVHTGERPFKCSVCGMQFTQSAHLKNHERIHSGERPYECDFCGKTFARHSTLWNHRRIHTGEKPYECEICGTCFNQASHLRNHGKVHTGEKPHKCDICDVGFSDKFALKRHRGIHEKYGQTAPNQTARVGPSGVSSNDSWKQSQPGSQQAPLDGQLFKCETASLKTSPSHPQMDDMYKCSPYPNCPEK